MSGCYSLSSSRMVAAESPLDDPLCKLNRNMRIQICSSVFESEYFSGWTKYVPRETSVSTECVKKAISFNVTAGDGYQEWMMHCTAEIVGTNVLSLFYLSRAYSSGQVFLYTRENWEFLQLLNVTIEKVRNVKE